MTAFQLEAERLASGRPIAGFYALPENRRRLEDAAHAAGVELVADLAAVLGAIRVAEAGPSLSGLDAGLVAIAAGKLTTAQLRHARARELARLDEYDADNAEAHARLQARAEDEARKGAARGRVPASPQPAEAPELVKFAAKWADASADYGIFATAKGAPSAGDVRLAIVRRLAVLGRELEARFQAEGEPKALTTLREAASTARARQADAAADLEAARLRARLVPCPETQATVAEAVGQLAAAEGAVTLAASRIRREFGVSA